MAKGYIVETDGGALFTVKWAEGEPKKAAFASSLKRTPMREMQTWRCVSCGFLESYAP
jgi:hypothetical protein